MTSHSAARPAAVRYGPRGDVMPARLKVPASGGRVCCCWRKRRWRRLPLSCWRDGVSSAWRCWWEAALPRPGPRRPVRLPRSHTPLPALVPAGPAAATSSASSSAPRCSSSGLPAWSSCSACPAAPPACPDNERLPAAPAGASAVVP